MTSRVQQDVSLIMTVLNEAVGLELFLRSLHAQGVLPAEIIVVDGGSTDGTVELLTRWRGPDELRITVIEIAGANISHGRNAAIAAASKAWIAVTDAGTFLDAGWLEALADQMSTDVDVVSGWFEPRGGSVISSTIAAVITPMLSDVDPERFLPSSRSVAFRRSAWEQVGGYPEWLDYCEDLVLDVALKSAGFAFVFTGLAVVTWDARPNLRAFFIQYFRYARGDGKANLWRKRHAARYIAYGLGASLIGGSIAARSLVPLGVLGVGVLAYMAKFGRRVLARRGTIIMNPLLSLLMTPFLVATGDVAKMIGYPVGVRWRARRATPTQSRPSGQPR